MEPGISTIVNYGGLSCLYSEIFLSLRSIEQAFFAAPDTESSPRMVVTLVLTNPFQEVIELVRPYASYVLPACFIAFFVSAFIAIGVNERDHVRSVFVAFFFIGLVLVNTVIPVAPLPFVNWGHFAQESQWENEVVHREIRVVDEHGNELKFDDRATLSFDGISLGPLSDAMVNRYSERRNEAVARHLVLEARRYRETVMNPPATRYVRYPHHGMRGTWTPEILEGYGTFVGIRIYEMKFVTSPDGTEVVDYEEELLVEVFPFEASIDRPPSPNETPPESINRTSMREQSAGTNTGNYS